MPNGEVLETEEMPQPEASAIINYALECNDHSAAFYLKYIGGEAHINSSLFQNCCLKLIKVDEPIKQPQPSEPKFPDDGGAFSHAVKSDQCTNFGLSDNPSQPTEKTNVGKRVEFKSFNGKIEGTIISESEHCYRIKNSDGELWIFKDKCTILEDQPKSNVGRMVKVDIGDEIYIDNIVYESDKEYVTIDKSGDLFVWDKSNCELLPE
jgi:RNase P/RNase MRP subunit p29